MGSWDSVGRFGLWTSAGAAMLLGLSAQSCGKLSVEEGASGASGAASMGTGGGLDGNGGAVSSSGSRGASAGARATGGDGAVGTDAGARGDGGASPGGSGAGSAAASGKGGASPSGGRGGSGGGVTVGFGGMAGTGGVGQCTGVLVTLTPAPSVLEFLIDSSGSMNDLPMGAPVSKWRVTVDALSETFRDMQGGTGVGLSFFPNTKAAPAAGACIVKEQAVPIGVLDATLLDSLLRALNAKLPAGTTPTHDAYSFALETLRASQLAGEKAVVLATDGAPNYALGCMGDGMASVDSAPLIAEAANALRADGIRTFVIGSPGSEPAREVLSKIAFEAGTGSAGCSVQGPAYCHFDMTTAPDLSAALNATLQTIAGASKSCRYGLPTPQVGSLDLNLVNLLLEDSAGASILLTTEPAGAGECHAGWRYTVDSKEIELCPDICARVNADPGARVAASLGCKGISR